jgi:simple sugar transport system substrate-binding protein
MVYTVGFSNLNDRHPFAITVRRGLEDAAAAYPDIKLILRDNAMDNDRASANAREFAAMPVDLVIHYHLDERANSRIVAPLSAQRIPIIAVDVPVVPWVTYFGANNQQVGLLVGSGRR